MKPFKVEVNGLDFEINPIKITKGLGAGGEVMLPKDLNKIDTITFVKAFGEQKVGKLLQSRVRALCNTITKKSTEEAKDKKSGEINEDLFRANYSRMLTELSPYTLTENRLKKRQLELVDILVNKLDPTSGDYADRVELIRVEMKQNSDQLEKLRVEEEEEPEEEAVATA